MRKLFPLILSFVLLGSAVAEEQTFRLTFSESDVELSQRDGGYTAISLKDGIRLPDHPGVPDVPVKIVKVRLPDGCDECLVQATATTVPLAKDLLAMPQQQPVPSGTEVSFTGPDAEAYASSELPELATLLSISRPRGYRVASIAVRPLRYNAAARTLDLATDIELTVTPKSAPYAMGTASEDVSRFSDRRRTFEDAINREVLNPFVAAAAPRSTAIPEAPTAGETYEYLIIAPAQFSSALQPLATFRQTFNGVHAKILTLEEIESGYSGSCPNGSTDTPMKMRNAIKDYVNNHGTEYVFLVGDVTLLPTRRVLITADEEVRGYHYYDCPADVYFRCLHGDWDTNKNGTWGDKGDEFDFSLDVYLGRLPVVSSAQVTAYVNKVIGYENDKGGGASFVKKTFMAGSECWRTVCRTRERFIDWSGNPVWQASNSGFFPRTKMNDGLPEFTDFTDSEPASDEMIWARYLFRDSINVGYGKGQTLDFLFDYLTSWDTGAKGSCECTGSNLEAKLNNGYHNVFMGCHGHFPVWCLEFYEDNSYTPGFFITNQASRITGRINHIYTTACLSAGWDNVVQVGEETGNVFNFEPCLAEAWLRNPNTCVTYIGNAREGWGYPYDTNGGYDQMYARAYYEQVNLVGARTIGEAYAESISKFGSIAKYATIFRWTNCSNQMLGDPMTTIITPQSFVAPDIGIPTAQATGGALSMSVPVTDLGVSGSRAAVVFEISVDDEHFTNPILVSGGSRISEPGTVSVNYNKLPPTAKIVFVRARVVPTSGNSALSETTSVLLATGTPSVAEALDTPGRTWETPKSGNYQWSPFAESASSGGYCVHASKGKIGSHELYLKTSVTGPAKMTFYTQKPTEGGVWNFYGYFDSYTNRNIFVETGPIEQMDEGATYGDAPWVKRVTFVPSGTHTVFFWYHMLAATYASSKSDFFIDRVLIRANEDGVDIALDPTGTPGQTSADLLLTVGDFSTMSQNATVKLEYSRFPDFSVSATNATTTTITGAGQKTLTLNNLNPGTEYYARALLTGPTKTLPLGMAHVQTAPRSGVTEPTVHGVTITKLTGTCATVDFDISVGSSGSTTVFAMIGGNSTWFQTITESKVYTVDYDDLSPGTTYTLTISLDGKQFTEFTTKFTTPDEAPPVGSVTVENVSSSSATAKLTLTSFGAGRTPVVGTLHYSTDSGFANEKTATASFTAAGTKSISLTGLSNDTTYYYYVVYAGIEDVYTPSASFKTQAYTAPEVASVAVSDVASSTATVSVGLKSLGNACSSATITVSVYANGGTTPVFTDSKSVTTAGISSFTVTGLTGGTSYVVKTSVVNNQGLEATGANTNFTTTDPNAPEFTVSVSSATRSSATVSIAISTLGQSGATSATPTVRLSKQANLSGAVSIAGSAIAGSSGTVTLTGLDAGTFYFLAVDLVNNLGKTATSKVVGFQTDVAYQTLPGLRQGIYGCTSKAVPDFTVRTASLEGSTRSNGTVKHAVDRTLGLLMAKKSAQGSDANSAPLVSDAVSTNSWKWTDTTTYLYEGQIYLEAGTTYYFYSKFDDGGAVFIDNRMIFSQEAVSGYDSWKSNTACTFGKLGVGVYACAATGWHDFRGYVWDWSGGKNIMAGVAAVQYTTDPSAIDGNTLGTSLTNAVESTISSTTLWHEIYDDGTGSFLRILTDAITAAPPSGTVAASAVSFTTATVTAEVTDLGDETSSADVTVSLVVSANADYSSPVFAANSATALLTGLSPDTTYYVRATFAGAHAGSSSATTTFKTAAYTAPDTPTVSVGGITRSSAVATVTLGSWGTGASGGQVDVNLFTADNQLVTTQSGTAGGSFTFNGLASGTGYKFVVTATAHGTGLSASSPAASFTTLGDPTVTLSAAVATVATNGASATLSVVVSDCDFEGGTLTLTLNGAAAASWTLANGPFSKTLAVTPGSTNSFVFTASGEGVTKTASGSFVATTYVGWFDVRFGDAGFREGEDWLALSTDPSGGTFTADETVLSKLVKDTDHSYVMPLEGSQGRILYTPSHPSETGADVRLEGRVQVVSSSSAVEIPEGAKAGLRFQDGIPYGYAESSWTAIGETVLPEKTWVSYVIEFNYAGKDAPRVRYTVGEATGDWVSAAIPVRNVQAVSFQDASFGDFKAGYYSVQAGEVIELVRPEFATDGTGAVLSGGTFSMTVANPVKGAYYTVFTAETLTATFTAEADSVRYDGSAPSLVLTVDGTSPTKFARIHVSTEPYVAGTAEP